MVGEKQGLSVVTDNTLISLLALHGKIRHVIEVLNEMYKRKFKPTAASYNPFIYRLAKEMKVDDVVKCLDQMIHRQSYPNVSTYNAITVLCEERMVKEAFSILRSFGEQQNSFIHYFYKKVILALYEMTVSGFSPNSYTYSTLIRGLCLEGMWNEAMEIFKILEESGYRHDLDNFNTLILGLSKCCRRDSALDIYEMMINKGFMPNHKIYTILVEGIVYEEEKELAVVVLKELSLRKITDLSLEVFEMKIKKGYMPNETTYTIMVEGIIHEEKRELAFVVLKVSHLRGVMNEKSLDRLVMQYELEGLSDRRSLKKDKNLKLNATKIK
ncbi:hypothetical protein LguiA_027479 [Lonicera macranthoides]